MHQFTLDYLANYVGAKYRGDGNFLVNEVNSLKSALSSEIAFFQERKYKKDLKNTKAGIIILRENDAEFTENKNLLISTNPYVDYAKISILFHPKVHSICIHPSSAIHSSARIGSNVNIGSGVCIEEDVTIGDNVSILANSFIGKGVTIGNDTSIDSNVSIYHGCILGKRCLIKANAVIGGDGFGHANDKGVWIKIPQLGKVILGNNVEIGSGTCVDRGSLEDTVIEDNVVIDNLCQVAHNVYIGYGTAIAGGVIIAGGVHIGRHCLIGGASVLNGYIRIADGASITGMSMVIRSIETKDTYSSGIPTQTNKQWRKTAALTLQIDKLYMRIKKLEQQFNNSEEV